MAPSSLARCHALLVTLLMSCLVGSVVPASQNQQLGFLARTGNESEVANAAAQQPDAINLVDSYGWTPLFWAVDAGNVGAARALLRAGADPYAKMAGSGWDALMWAAGMPQAQELVTLLVAELEVDPNRKADNGFTALMAACKGGSRATVKALLDAGADVDAADEGGVTALMLAAGGNEVGVAEELVTRGARLNQMSDSGWSAASFAATGRREEMLQWLLDNGAAAEAESQPGTSTPLATAAKVGHAAVMASLLASHRHSASTLAAALQIASARGHADCVETALESGAGIDGVPSEVGGLRALAAAAAGGHVEVVKTLLKAGAKPGAVAADPPGGTPLESASRGSTPGCRAAHALLMERVAEEVKGKGPREGWSADEVADWLCLSSSFATGGRAGGCRLARAFRATGMDGRITFGVQPAMGESDVRDGWAVISWARAVGGDAHAALATAIATDFAFREEQPQWFIRAGRANMKELLQAMAASGLQPWTIAAPNMSVLEAAKDSPALLAILEPAMRAHLARTPTISSWTKQDVVHWLMLEPSLREVAPLLKAEVLEDRAGAALASLLEPFCSTDAAQQEGGEALQPCYLGLPPNTELEMDVLLRWSVGNDLPAVAEWAVRALLLQSAAPVQKLWKGGEGGSPSVGETLVAASPRGFQAALKLAMPPLVKQLRTTALPDWQPDYVRALAALTLPAEVLAALTGGGCLSSPEAMAGPRGGLISWPPMGHDVAQPSAQFHPDRLLSWACHSDCPALARHIVELAKNVSTADHASLLSWAALHKELPPVKQLRASGGPAAAGNGAVIPPSPPLLLQCGSQLIDAAVEENHDDALERDWQTVREAAAGIIAARVASIPPPSWTSTDLVNWLLAAGQRRLAAAAQADGVDGGQLSKFNIQAMQMFDPQSKAQSLPIGVPPAELLQWAVAEGKRAIAGVLLVEHCHVARPAWGHGTSGGPSPYLVAQEHNLTEAVGVLRKRVQARLVATPVAEWTEIDVGNWLRGNGAASSADASPTPLSPFVSLHGVFLLPSSSKKMEALCPKALIVTITLANL